MFRFSTEGGRRRIRGDGSCKMIQHPTQSGLVSCRTTDMQHTHTRTTIHTRPRKPQAHLSEQQLQGRKWGQGIRRRAPLLPFNQTAFSLAFICSLVEPFFFFDSNRFTLQQKSFAFLSFFCSFLCFLFLVQLSMFRDSFYSLLFPSSKCYTFVIAFSLLYSLKPV